jgi:hypothetical protein
MRVGEARSGIPDTNRAQHGTRRDIGLCKLNPAVTRAVANATDEIAPERHWGTAPSFPFVTTRHTEHWARPPPLL